MQHILGKEQDLFFMMEALKEAQRAYDQDEVPVGALVVNSEDEIVARAYNQIEAENTQCAHAELLALAQAGHQLGDWRLLDCTIYVTLEPCKMCMYAIRLHRLTRVVYAADSPLFGYQLDKKEFDSVYKNDTIQIVSGIAREESEQLLKQFFKKRREKHD